MLLSADLSQSSWLRGGVRLEGAAEVKSLRDTAAQKEARRKAFFWHG